MAEIGCKYSKELTVLPSMCDDTSRLSIGSAFDLFQDYATLHADLFGIGPEGMQRQSSFWVITKTRLHINRMPIVMDKIVLKTWMQEPERASCERDYLICSGDETLVYGRSIWAVMSRERARPVAMKKLYPVLDFCEPRPDEMPFAKIDRDFEDAETIGGYTVRSTDIDIGGHMNNVHYIRAMLGCFGREELKAMDIKDVEVQFIHQTYEAQMLTFKYRKVESGALEIGAVNESGETVFTSIIK